MSRVVIELNDTDVRDAIDYVRQHLDNQEKIIEKLDQIIEALNAKG